MRAVSIRQPWAWLAVNGHLDLLNMDWPTDYRGEFLIRAGGKIVKRDYRAAAALAREALQVEVPDVDDEAALPRGGIVGLAHVVRVSGPPRHMPVLRAMLSTGPHVWQLEAAQPLPFTPFNPPYRGADLRWFDVPRALAGAETSRRLDWSHA